MNFKPLIIFIVLAYAGYYVGGILLDMITPLAPDIFSGLVGEILNFSIPTALVFLGWQKFGKKG